MPINKIDHSQKPYNVSHFLPKTAYQFPSETLTKPIKINYVLPRLQYTPRFQFQTNYTDLYIRLINLQQHIEQCIDTKSTIVLEEDEIIWIYLSKPIPYDENCVNTITNHLEKLLQRNRNKWLPNFQKSFQSLTNNPHNRLVILSSNDSDIFTIGRPKSKFSEVNFPFTSQGYQNLCCYLKTPNKASLLDKIKNDAVLYDKYLDVQNRLRYLGIHLHLQPNQYHIIIPNSTNSIFGCRYEFSHSLPKLRTLIAPLTAPRRELWQKLYTSELSNLTDTFRHITTFFTDISLQSESPNSKRSFAFTPDGYEEFLTYIDWIQSNQSL